ncbi:substrate-binding domain-containing protein [Candidatus Sumerlaeota bacterium]|nr:substrate-binding domain-containing protein [Candidatus Sumerlaeota bacterium]
MRKSAFFITWACILSICVFFGGCGGSEQTTQPAEKPPQEESREKVVVGVTLLTRTHPFYQDLEEGLKEQAAANNYELLISTGEFDVAKQKDQVADFIVKKVNAIVVCPCDSTSIGTSIAKANEAGIPVFTADIACLAEGAKVECHIASDNVEGGKLAAQAMAKALGGAGRVAIIDHPEVESVIQRVKGFEEEIAKFDNIRIVTKLPGGGVKDKAFKVAEDILQANPDLNGIFGINDDSALGALAAVEKADKLGKITIVGFDAVPEARKAIKEGKIYADAIQQPREIGKKTVEMISLYLKGEVVPKQLLIPCGLYTKENAGAN